MFQSELLGVHSCDPIERTASGVQITRHSEKVGKWIDLVWKTFWFPERGKWLVEASSRPDGELASQAEQEEFRAEEEALRAGASFLDAKWKAFRAWDAVYDTHLRGWANDYDALREQVLTAPQVILIHDIGLSGALWQTVAVWLAEHDLVVHVPSLPGHGGREWKSVGYTERWTMTGPIHAPCMLADHVDSMDDLIKSIRSTSGGLFLVGVGIGGIVAQLCAQVLPVKGLALIGACLPHRAEKAWQRWKYADTDLAPMEPGQVSSVSKRARQGWELGRDILAPEKFSAASDDFKDDFRQLARQGPQPVQAKHFLVAAGENDSMLSREELEATADFYHVPLTLFPDGHLPMLGKHNQQVAAQLFNFIQSEDVTP